MLIDSRRVPSVGACRRRRTTSAHCVGSTRAIPEVYASDDATEDSVRDLVAAWNELMNLDRFDLVWVRCRVRTARGICSAATSPSGRTPPPCRLVYPELPQPLLVPSGVEIAGFQEFLAKLMSDLAQ